MHIGVSVCAALEAAHENGVIHRDVKPGNILLMKDGRVMLTDFGIAKVLGEGEDLTSENIMMGTAKYLSPEQVRGDTLDARADLYSLGIVLYECLVGRAPFVGKNDTETALARLQREPKNITSLRPSVNPQFAAVVHKLLARDPRQRFRTAADARLALSAVNAPPAREPEVVSRPVKDRTPPTGKVIRPKGHTPTGSPTPSTSTAKTGEARSTSASRSVPARSSILRTSSPSRLGIGLAALAVLVVGILISQSTGDDGAPAGPGVVTTDAVTTPLYTGPVEITGVKSHDPEGDDKAENEESVLLATDGDPSTIWTTSCYRSATFGSKSGVGLIVQLNAVALAQIEADVAGSSWKARVYTSAQAMETTAPTSQWGRPIWEGSSEGGSTLKATFTTPAQYALIFFTEVGRSGACSTKNPYRGGISEVRVSPAP
jgi:serine/threonine-protein kinase